jgi:hypothetical protein
MARPKFKSETDLAKKVIQWLEADKWDVYQEVQVRGGGNCADIIAQRGALVIIIECKLSAGMDVLSQLMEWEGYAHYILAAVPHSGPMFKLILKKFGFGVIPVCARDGIYHWSLGDMRRKPYGIEDTRKSLIPIRKTFAEAGNNWGARWSPYQQTCHCLLEIVQKEPGITLKSAIALLSGKHHYANDQSARGSLLKWGLEGSVKGVRFERIGKQILLHPVTSLKVSEITK